MIPYFFSFSISILFVSIAEKYKKRKRNIYSMFYLLIACICLSLLAAFRSDVVGTDLNTYVIRHFNYALESTSFSMYRAMIADESVELLYSGLCWFFSRLSYNYRIWLFFIEFWDMSFLFAFLWKQRDKYSITMGSFMVMMVFYNISFNAIRQMMALSVCTYAWIDARDKKLKSYIVLMIIAASLHISSLLMLITYPLCRIFEKKGGHKIDYLIFIVVLLSIIFLLAFNPIISSLIKTNILPIKFLRYIGNRYSISRLSAFVFVLPSLFIFILFRKKLYEYDKFNAVLFCFIFIWPLFAQLDSIADQLGRLAFGFFMANIALFAQVPRLKGIRRKEMDLKLLTVFFVVFWIGYWFINFYAWKVGETVPYVWGI